MNRCLLLVLFLCSIVFHTYGNPDNGKDRVFLPKNMSGDVNILTQDMFFKGESGHRVPNTNTIFVIQFDFTLSEDVTIPANCVLEFTGGCISNGSITGNNTQIRAQKEIIFKGVTISGTWNVPEITTKWFGDAGKLDVLREVLKLTDENIKNTVTVESGTHLVSISEWGGSAICLKSNTKVNLIGDIALNTTTHGRYNIVDIAGAENVSIYGCGSIIGDLETHIRELHNDYWGEWGFGIRITESNNVVIDGITVCKCWGDCIMIGETRFSDETFATKDATKLTTIKNVTLHSARRQGISVTHSEDCIIQNAHIYNIHRTSYNKLGPAAGIDIEPDIAMWVKKLSISNVKIHNCDLGIQTYCRIPMNYSDSTIFPSKGNENVIYIDDSTNKHYMWSLKKGYYEINILNKPCIENIRIASVDISDLSFYITPPESHKNFGLHVCNVQNFSVSNSSFDLTNGTNSSLFGSCVQIRNCSDNLLFDNIRVKGSVEAFYIGVPIHGKAVGRISVKNSCFENPIGSDVCWLRNCMIEFENTRFIGNNNIASNKESIYPWAGCNCKFDKCSFDVGIIKSASKEFEIVNSTIICKKMILAEGNKIKKSAIQTDVSKLQNSSYGISGSSYLLSDCNINATIKANTGCRILNNMIVLTKHPVGLEKTCIVRADGNTNIIQGNTIKYKPSSTSKKKLYSAVFLNGVNTLLDSNSIYTSFVEKDIFIGNGHNSKSVKMSNNKVFN